MEERPSERPPGRKVNRNLLATMKYFGCVWNENLLEWNWNSRGKMEQNGTEWKLLEPVWKLLKQGNHTRIKLKFGEINAEFGTV